MARGDGNIAILRFHIFKLIEFSIQLWRGPAGWKKPPIDLVGFQLSIFSRQLIFKTTTPDRSQQLENETRLKEILYPRALLTKGAVPAFGPASIECRGGTFSETQ